MFVNLIQFLFIIVEFGYVAFPRIWPELDVQTSNLLSIAAQMYYLLLLNACINACFWDDMK